jgi:hypothetical protein
VKRWSATGRLICAEQGRSEHHEVVMYRQEIQLSAIEREIVDSAELVPESDVLLSVGYAVKLICGRKQVRKLRNPRLNLGF